jgi:LETM1 and EF-hand domain-containing protein 1, mitochondrial
MFRLATKTKTISYPLNRSQGWFWVPPERLIYNQKGIVWQKKRFDFNFTIYHHIKSEILKTWKCCKIIFRDGKSYFWKKYRVTFYDENITIKDRHKMTTTKVDLIKMIPFSFFIIVPGAELTLPLCLYLFPNMIPSTFISKTKEEKNIVHLLDARNVYADALYNYMLKKIEEQDEDLVNFETLLKKNPFNLSKNEMIEYHDLFPQLFGFSKMDNETLLNVCRLVTMEPWTGFKVIGKLIFEPYNKIKSLITKTETKPWVPNNHICDAITSYLLIYQIKNHLKNVRDDDYLLLTDIDEIDHDNVVKCCRQRAIETENNSFTQIVSDLKDWVQHSTQPLSKGKTSNEFMVLTQIFPYLQESDYLGDVKIEVKPSNERTKAVLDKISMKKFHGFNEKMVLDILERVRISEPEYFDEEVRESHIEKLKETLDEKYMPEKEDSIKRAIKKLESVLPENVIKLPQNKITLAGDKIWSPENTIRLPEGMIWSVPRKYLD